MNSKGRYAVANLFKDNIFDDESKQEQKIGNNQENMMIFRFYSNLSGEDNQKDSIQEYRSRLNDEQHKRAQSKSQEKSNKIKIAMKKEQIKNINGYPDKIKYILALQNGLHKVMKQKMQSLRNERQTQYMKKIQKSIETSFSTKLELLVWNKSQCFANEQSNFFLSKPDKIAVRRLRNFKTFLKEEYNFFLTKKGLQNSQDNRDERKKLIQNTIQFIKLSKSAIKGKELVNNLKSIIFEQLKNNKRDLSNSLSKERNILIDIHQKLRQKVQYQMKELSTFRYTKIASQVQNENMVCEHSENLIGVVPIKRLFELIPHDNYEERIQFQQKSFSSFRKFDA